MRFIDIKNKETGGTARIPDEPGVVEWYEARGWEKYTPEPEKPFHPEHSPEGEPEPEFVELGNAETGARHLFPNNPEALQGAAESGWIPVQKITDFEHIVTTPEISEPIAPRPHKTRAAKTADDSSEKE